MLDVLPIAPLQANNDDSLTFSGEHERPDAGEVIFADEQGHVHARRWCNRQSALSAIRPATARVCG